MCGILGTVNIGSLPFNDYSNLMLHRGPDRQKHLGIHNLNLYHYRLSIQDLSDLADQPMSYKHYHIIFNGEIYNHLQLRKDFNLNCKTHSDTETILHLYALLGKDFLSQCDGMFALAIYDDKKKELFLARDRAGEKPLYYYKKKDRFVFASEQKTLQKITKPDLNFEVVNEYFFIGSQFQEQTVYDNIYELRNGYTLTVDTHTLKCKEEKWWSILGAYTNKVDMSLEEAKTEFTNLFDISVRRRVESSDLEVGSFLSGGIDSGLVTASASKYTDKLKTFTVAFEGTYNEAPLAKLVAHKFNTIHTEIAIDFTNLKKDFENIISNYGEPFMDSSAIPSFYVSKEAKKHLTVILNGDGADELFGGYRRYVPFAHYDFFNTHRSIQKLASQLLKYLPTAHTKQSTYNYVHRLINFTSKNGAESYLAATTDIFTGFESAFFKVPKLHRLREEINTINNTLTNGLDKMMCLDFQTLLFGDMLVKMDIATMANSLEGRSPFLSKELLDFAPSLSKSLKIRGKTTKYLLRQVARDVLPPEIFNQPKRGFEIPLKKWIDNDLKEILMDNITSTNTLYLNFLDKKFVNQLVENKIEVSNEKRAKMLYALLCLEVWHKKLA